MPPPTLTLKQRLANLSAAASAHSGPSAQQPSPNPTITRSPSFGALGYAAAKGKGLFNNASRQWSNASGRTNNESINHDRDYSQKIDDVLSRMIFQAGVDNETRPMVVMTACAFPDPHVVSYDLLLSLNGPLSLLPYTRNYLVTPANQCSRILSYLDLFAESDYTVVFFAAGGHHTPSWNWVWKAYRSLSRKYRKNLKRLYIVHSSFFSKMLFSLAGTIISPKFFRKITYIDTLSSLACHVPLTQIDIPPTVYSENLKHESQITMPIPVQSRMFGVSLNDLMGFDGEKDGLPRVVRDCIHYLRDAGLEEEGLFRRSPSSQQLRQIQEAYNRGQTVSLRTFGDPHLAAVLLKKFLRDLPEPVFPEGTYSVVKNCPLPAENMDDMASVLYVRETLLPELAPCTLILLNSILHILHEVSLRSSINKMDAHNLAIVLTPNLVSSGNPLKDVAICAVAGAPEPLSPISRNAPAHPADEALKKIEGKTTLGTIIKLCIQRYYEVFDDIPDRAEAADPFYSGEAEEKLASVRNASREGEEDVDEDLLVMRVGLGSPASPAFPGGSNVQYSGYAVRSVASGESRGMARLASLGSVSKAKARSLLTPSLSTESTSSRKGTVMPTGSKAPPASIVSSAAATMRKSSGAGVTAHSVTAAGFFTASNPATSPSQNASLPPPLHPMSSLRRNEGSNN